MLLCAAMASAAESKPAEPIDAAWLKPMPPAFKVPGSLAEWKQKREEVRATLWKLLGDLPPRPKSPDVKTVAREEQADFIKEKLEIDNGAGFKIPAYLLLPKRIEGKAPAILYCHWHGGQYDIGKEEIFRTNAVPVAAGPALAARGYVVLAIDADGFGERNGKGPGGPNERGGAQELTSAKYNLWVGRTLWGMMVRDDLVALDYLAARPEVDAKRIAATGISMGSTRTWWLMALDERIACGVGICCWTRYQDLIEEQWIKAHGIYYFVPGVLKHFDTEAITALAAPRPLLFQSGELDDGSPVTGIRKMEPVVRSAYELYEAESNFRSDIFPGVGHQYTPKMWEGTLKWLDAHLKNAPVH
jgi:dienelactone hydrolase